MRPHCVFTGPNLSRRKPMPILMTIVEATPVESALDSEVAHFVPAVQTHFTRTFGLYLLSWSAVEQLVVM